MKKEIKKSLKLKSVVKEMNDTEKSAIKGAGGTTPVTCPQGYATMHGGGTACKWVCSSHVTSELAW
jgi:hypothetical protein